MALLNPGIIYSKFQGLSYRKSATPNVYPTTLSRSISSQQSATDVRLFMAITNA
jgi:hypothetical protein